VCVCATGQKGFYCHHGTEAFPAWHRFYLRDFEYALQQNDIALDAKRDVSLIHKYGPITLPYWYVTTRRQVSTGRG